MSNIPDFLAMDERAMPETTHGERFFYTILMIVGFYALMKYDSEISEFFGFPLVGLFFVFLFVGIPILMILWYTFIIIFSLILGITEALFRLSLVIIDFVFGTSYHPRFSDWAIRMVAVETDVKEECPF